MSEGITQDQGGPNPEILELLKGDHWKLPSNLDLDLIDGIDDEIIKRLTAAGWDEETSHRLMVGFHELLINCMKHGNKFDVSKSVTADLNISPDQVRFELEDEGEGFDEPNKPGPRFDKMETHGKGIDIFTRPFFDSLVYNDKGNKVRLIRNKVRTNE